jgi:hypothetical protein
MILPFGLFKSIVMITSPSFPMSARKVGKLLIFLYVMERKNPNKKY